MHYCINLRVCKHKAIVSTINPAGNSWMAQNARTFSSFSKLAFSFRYTLHQNHPLMFPCDASISTRKSDRYI